MTLVRMWGGGVVRDEAIKWLNADVWFAKDATACGGSATQLTPWGEEQLKPGALSADNSGVNAPVVGWTWPHALRLATGAQESLWLRSGARHECNLVRAA